MQDLVDLSTIPADPHIEWAKQRRHLQDVMEIEDDEIVQDALYAHFRVLAEKIANTPAQSPLGIIEQVRLALGAEDAHSAMSKAEVMGLRSAVAALEALAKGA